MLSRCVRCTAVRDDPVLTAKRTPTCCDHVTMEEGVEKDRGHSPITVIGTWSYLKLVVPDISISNDRDIGNLEVEPPRQSVSKRLEVPGRHHKIRSLFGTGFGIQFLWNQDLLLTIVGHMAHDYLIENNFICFLVRMNSQDKYS